ncbi:MAG: MFS transporter [Actinobacteria bacterium]|nr:MFS transporter [Actinomycetota bacterium]
MILAAATVTQAGSGFVMIGIASLNGYFRAAFQLNATLTGLIVTSVGLVPLFTLLVAGRTLDTYGERRVVTGGALWLAAGTGLAALAPSYGFLLAAFLVGGAGYATSQPGGSKAVARWFEPERRGLAMGIRQTGLPLGGALAAASLPQIAERTSFRVALATAAAVALGAGLLFGAVYREPRGRAQSGGYGLRRELKRLLGKRNIRPALWSGLALVTVQFCLVSYLMLWLRDVHDIALTSGGWLLFAAQASGMAGRVALATWSDRSKRRMQPVRLSLVATAALLIVMVLVPRGAPTVVLLIVATLLGFFAYGWYGPWVVHVSELAAGKAVGLTLAFAMTANQLGIVAGPPVFGLVLDVTGSYSVAWLLLVACLLLAMGMVTKDLAASNPLDTGRFFPRRAEDHARPRRHTVVGDVW